MKTIQTRWLLIKRQIFGLLFWLVFPFLITWGIMSITDTVQKEAKIPIGMIQYDDSKLANRLIERLEQSNLLHIYEMKEDEAIRALTRHELDSVFVIHEDYEKNIQAGKRDGLITGYESNLSFAYVPVKEIVVSNVQRDTLRIKAASYIQMMEEEYNSPIISDRETIIADINKTENLEQLLSSTLVLKNEDFTLEKDQPTIFDPWHIWALVSYLATFFIFDWVIKERTAPARVRLYFTNSSWQTYFLKHFTLFTIGLFIFDMLTYIGFSFLFNGGSLALDTSFLISLLIYRLTINLTAFILAMIIRSLAFYYSFAAGFTLLVTITSTAILPIDYLMKKLSWLSYINPVQVFIYESFGAYWLFLMLAMLIFWLIRRESYDA